MATFPLLSTGAVCQYPLQVRSGVPVGVIEFLDGTSQRFQARGKMLRQWRIQLNLLNEIEMRQLSVFFGQQWGECETFVFTDPMDGSNVPNCRFAGEDLPQLFVKEDSGSVEIWVTETNG